MGLTLLMTQEATREKSPRTLGPSVNIRTVGRVRSRRRSRRPSPLRTKDARPMFSARAAALVPRRPSLARATPTASPLAHVAPNTPTLNRTASLDLGYQLHPELTTSICHPLPPTAASNGLRCHSRRPRSDGYASTRGRGVLHRRVPSVTSSWERVFVLRTCLCFVLTCFFIDCSLPCAGAGSNLHLKSGSQLV